MSSVCARTYQREFSRTPANRYAPGTATEEFLTVSRVIFPVRATLSSVQTTKLTRESHDAIPASHGTDVDARGCNLA
jgi:hypothetical protein